MRVNLYRLKLLLGPSLISGMTAIILASAALGYAGWMYINSQQLFYDQLFSAYGSLTALQANPHTLDAMFRAILNGRATYYVVLLAGSVVIGLTIYMVLESVSHLLKGTSLFIHELREDQQTARSVARETLVRLGLRCASIAGWTAYLLFFMYVLTPTSMGLLQQGLSDINNSHILGWFYVLLALGLMIVGLHLHVTFARLTLLRVRLFGGLDAEMSQLDDPSRHS